MDFSGTFFGIIRCLALIHITLNAAVRSQFSFNREGEYSALYPKLCISLNVLKSDLLHSYALGSIENLRYPKDRIDVQLVTEKNIDALKAWKKSTGDLYHSVEIVDSALDWYEEALTFGRFRRCGVAFLSTTDFLLDSNSLLNLIHLNKTVVSPLIVSPFSTNSNGCGLVTGRHLNGEISESLQTYFVRTPMLINLKKTDSSYLTFDGENILSYKGPTDPINVFAFAAYSMSIPLYLDNQNFYGYFVDSSSVDSPAMLSSLFVHLYERGFPISQSASIPSWKPPLVKFGFDEIYVINLERRKERRRRINDLMGLMGINYTLFNAVDGRSLTVQQLSGITILPGYVDPFHKRPLTKGEIGCFLSHLKIWKEMVDRDYDRIIIFEDDVRFEPNATIRLQKTIEDLMKTQTQWDLIYLGRKKNDASAKEFFVKGHRYLSTVTYSYWTLGYALSRSGAQKLLAAEPLSHLLALDEFLPIMYNQHPNSEWSSYFPIRNLVAFTVYPLIVQPERYTYEEGHISDTEDSNIFVGLREEL